LLVFILVPAILISGTTPETYRSNLALLNKSMYEKLPKWEPPNGNGHQKAEGVAAHANLGMFDATLYNQDVPLVKRAPGNANTPQFQNQTP
jgi:hypothetical protein